MATITYPLLTVLDDAGAIVTGATVTIASVTDRDGTPITGHGAAVHQAGANVSVDYDAELHGEAWITLAVAAAGSTITGLNAAPSFYLSRDSSRINSVAAGVTLADGAITDAKFTIPPVTGRAAGIVGMILQLWRARFNRNEKVNGHLVSYHDDESTVMTDQTFSVNGNNETLDAVP